MPTGAPPGGRRPRRRRPLVLAAALAVLVAVVAGLLLLPGDAGEVPDPGVEPGTDEPAPPGPAPDEE